MHPLGLAAREALARGCVSAINEAYEAILPWLVSRRSDLSGRANWQGPTERRALCIVMDKLGNPHKQLDVVHVAGTNGKGSTSRKIAAGLRASGARAVGLYSSPHIASIRERICIGDQFISKFDFVKAFSQVVDASRDVDGTPLNVSFFELVTAMMFLYFHNGPTDPDAPSASPLRPYCDFAVVEVGMGGRLDATNIIEHSRCSVIVSIGWDHMNILGNSLNEIAREKAGILKPGCPVVLGPQATGFPGIDDKITELLCSPVVRVTSPFASIDEENSAVAEAALKLILKEPWGEKIRMALKEVPPFRMFRLSQEQLETARASIGAFLEGTLADSVPAAVYLDVGHNSTALQRVFSHIQKQHPDSKLRFAVALSMNRKIDVLEDGLRTLVEAGRQNDLLGLHYLSSSHARIRPRADLLQEAEEHPTLLASHHIARTFTNDSGYHMPATSSPSHPAMPGSPLQREIAWLFQKAAAEQSVLTFCGSVFIMQDVAQTLGLSLQLQDSMDTNEPPLLQHVP